MIAMTYIINSKHSTNENKLKVLRYLSGRMGFSFKWMESHRRVLRKKFWSATYCNRKVVWFFSTRVLVPSFILQFSWPYREILGAKENLQICLTQAQNPLMLAQEKEVAERMGGGLTFCQLAVTQRKSQPWLQCQSKCLSGGNSPIWCVDQGILN